MTKSGIAPQQFSQGKVKGCTEINSTSSQQTLPRTKMMHRLLRGTADRRIFHLLERQSLITITQFQKALHHPGSRCALASPAAAQTAAFPPRSTALKGDRHKSSLPETSFLQQNTTRHSADLLLPAVPEYPRLFVFSGGIPSPQPPAAHTQRREDHHGFSKENRVPEL